MGISLDNYKEEVRFTRGSATVRGLNLTDVFKLLNRHELIPIIADLIASAKGQDIDMMTAAGRLMERVPEAFIEILAIGTDSDVDSVGMVPASGQLAIFEKVVELTFREDAGGIDPKALAARLNTWSEAAASSLSNR